MGGVEEVHTGVCECVNVTLVFSFSFGGNVLYSYARAFSFLRRD
jgi:hypothetical protein